MRRGYAYQVYAQYLSISSPIALYRYSRTCDRLDGREPCGMESQPSDRQIDKIDVVLFGVSL